MKNSPAHLLQATREVAAQAASLVRAMHEKPRTVKHKGRIDLVTETDIAVEVLLKERLLSLVPEAVFIGEEGAHELAAVFQAGNDVPEYCWVVDPVDGTTNYAHGLPIVGTAIAFCVHGQPVVGVVELPLMFESWYAAKGCGTFVNNKSVQVSKTATLETSLLATGFPYSIEDDVDMVLARLRSALVHTRGVRRCGAAAVDLAWLAGGRFDVFYETGLKPWDMAASWCLITEAGGKVTHMDGSSFTLGRDDILATNGIVHEEALAMLNHTSANSP